MWINKEDFEAYKSLIEMRSKMISGEITMRMDRVDGSLRELHGAIKEVRYFFTPVVTGMLIGQTELISSVLEKLETMKRKLATLEHMILLNSNITMTALGVIEKKLAEGPLRVAARRKPSARKRGAR